MREERLKFDVAEVNAVEDAVWKPPHHCPSNIKKHLRIEVRIVQDSINGFIEAQYEIGGQAGANAVIPVDCMGKIGFGQLGDF